MTDFLNTSGQINTSPLTPPKLSGAELQATLSRYVAQCAQLEHHHQHDTFWRVQKIGIVGAGKMGTDIATATTASGIKTLLKDVNLAQAEKGRLSVVCALNKKYERGYISHSQLSKQLALLYSSASPSELSDCDLIIEAVYENRELKTIVLKEASPYLKDGAIMASNTCNLPISDLARACQDAARFIGIHFFSPVSKIQLLELIVGKNTSRRSLSCALAFAHQIGKFAIVVNDARGFFSSRVFSAFINEGIAMLGEGVPAATVEQAALNAGMPIGPLAAQDEISLTLSCLLCTQTQQDLAAQGKPYSPHPASTIIEQMVMEHKRCGRACGAGFYDDAANDDKQLWPELDSLFGHTARPPVSPADMHDRILYCQSLETLRCLEQGVLMSVPEANLGSIMGIGFPATTGGAIEFIHRTGPAVFAARAEQLRQCYGERFAPPDILLNHTAVHPLF